MITEKIFTAVKFSNHKRYWNIYIVSKVTKFIFLLLHVLKLILERVLY